MGIDYRENKNWKIWTAKPPYLKHSNLDWSLTSSIFLWFWDIVFIFLNVCRADTGEHFHICMTTTFVHLASAVWILNQLIFLIFVSLTTHRNMYHKWRTPLIHRQSSESCVWYKECSNHITSVTYQLISTKEKIQMIVSASSNLSCYLFNLLNGAHIRPYLWCTKIQSINEKLCFWRKVSLCLKFNYRTCPSPSFLIR